LIEDDHAADTVVQHARRYVTTHHSAAAYAAAMRELLGEPKASPQARRPAPHPAVA
jgi:Arc/MetJ family transcription regulator